MPFSCTMVSTLMWVSWDGSIALCYKNFLLLEKNLEWMVL